MKKQGSAIITIIVAIVVLTILALSFISSKSQRANINKYLSDEKKAETLAESVSDLVLSYIKSNSNKEDKAKNLYYFLRMPMKYKDLAIADGANYQLDIPASNKLDDELYNHVKTTIEPVIEELDWKDKVKITSSCEISNAEAFGPSKNVYRVTGINKEHLEATGNSAKFLDSDINSISFTADGDDWKPSDWKLDIGFPGNNDNYIEKDFKVRIKLSSGASDAVNEIQSISNLLDDAKNDLASAKNDLENAPEDATEEQLKALQDAVTEAEETVNQIQADYDSAFSNYENYSSNVNSGGLKVTVTLKVTRGTDPEDPSNTMYLDPIKAGLSGFLKFVMKMLGLKTSYDLDPINIKKIIEDSKFFPDIRPVAMQGLKKKVMGEDPANYNFQEYVQGIQGRMTEVVGDFGSDHTLDSSVNSNPMVIEKGAILRITTKVEYKQNETKTITRELVSEIPFKVSDVQPIAPEYSFFIANSSLITNPDDDIDDEHVLGTPIDLNNADDTVTSTQAYKAAGRFIVHNLPFDGDKPSYGEVGNSTGRVPGMVRVNCNYEKKGDPVTELRSFIGCFEEPQLTELNQMLTPNYTSLPNKFKTRPAFYWVGDTPKRKHEVEFPVLFEERDIAHKIEIPGVKGFVDVYRRGGFNVVMVPTLLYGMGHMEYPLGINAEGPINSVYSRIRVRAKPAALVCPKADPVVTDTTEIYYDYEPVTTYSPSTDDNGEAYAFDDTANDPTKYGGPAYYGMVGYPCYNANGTWKSNSDYKYMPANCYDAMQYAKKATRFYEKGSEFMADCKKLIKNGGLKDETGNVVLSGVYYIKDSLNLPESEGEDEITFKGNGLIVVNKGVIDIKRNIKRADDNTTVGIIARTGFITFNCDEVYAACFSNAAPSFPNGGIKPTKIYGNLVCNYFNRKDVLDAEIFYDNRITSVTPLASLRKVGKFEPKRYYVEFANNWSKFNYEKSK